MLKARATLLGRLELSFALIKLMVIIKKILTTSNVSTSMLKALKHQHEAKSSDNVSPNATNLKTNAFASQQRSKVLALSNTSSTITSLSNNPKNSS